MTIFYFQYKIAIITEKNIDIKIYWLLRLKSMFYIRRGQEFNGRM